MSIDISEHGGPFGAGGGDNLDKKTSMVKSTSNGNNNNVTVLDITGKGVLMNTQIVDAQDESANIYIDGNLISGTSGIYSLRYTANNFIYPFKQSLKVQTGYASTMAVSYLLD